MSNDTLLLLVMSQDAPKTPFTSNGEERIQQYLNGINKLFEYNFTDKADVMVCDNTTQQLDKRIIQALPFNTLYLTYNNNTGIGSKSKGLFDQWKCCLEEINKYEWVIHFEPRQLLKSHIFFDSFFSNQRNLFKSPTHDIWTGLFCLQADIFKEYIETYKLGPQENIESSMFNFMKNHKYYTEKKLDLLWNGVAPNINFWEEI